MQLELKTSHQTQEMPDRNVTFEPEHIRLQQENLLLQQENVRLQREVDDMKRDFAHQERQLTKAVYRIYELKSQLHSSASFGQVMLVIGSLVAVFVLLYYGSGFVDFSMSSHVEDEVPVVERTK